MKRLSFSYFWILGFILTLLSCQPSRMYYNERMAEDFQWSEKDLQKIQFYISEDIVLTRQIRKGEAIISGGKVKRTKGREIEQVIIRRGTPGTYLFTTSEGHYAITFDSANRNHYLIFGPVAKVRNRYGLRAKKWERSFGIVTYGGREYTTTPRSAQAFLLINSKGQTTTKVSRKTERGSRVP